MSALEKLKAAKKTADKAQTDRDNYKAYITDRNKNTTWWPENEVAAYRTEVERIMKNGTPDEKAAASEFWQLKADELRIATSSNARIRQFIDRMAAA